MLGRSDRAAEARLVARARAGDRSAFDDLVERYAPQIYNLSLRITGSPEEAEDCVQETFLRAYSAMHTFRGQAAFFTWLYQVALNVARDSARRRRHQAVSLSELVPQDDQDGPSDPALGLAADDPSLQPEEALVAQRRRQLVLSALAALPEHHREVIVLYDLQGLSYEDIARVLNTRVGTVKSRLNRARLALRDLLAPHLELLRD